MIIPEGKMEKFIKYYFSLIILIVIITPLINIKNNGINFDYKLNGNDIILQENYLEYVYELRINTYKKQCEKIAESCGVKNVVFEFEYIIDEKKEFMLNKIYLNFKNAVIISDKEHINIIEDVKQSVAKQFLLDESKIIIYD